MSTIRKQSIISSFVVYFGFALGFLNTYLFAREGGFTKEEYGLTGAFIAIGNIMFSFANLGMIAYVTKFFPYYRDKLHAKKNDLITWALLISTVGFLIVVVAGILLKGVLVDEVYKNSPGILTYYYWLFPFGFGLTIFSIMEAYAWQHQKAVLTNFTKEVLFRFLVTILIIFSFTGIIKSFDLFIKLYSFLYIVIALVLIFFFVSRKRLHLTFKRSDVTRRFQKKIITLASFNWGGQLIFNIANVFDTIVLTAVMPNGLAFAALFTLAQNISSLIQAPQRGIITSSIGALSQSWKDKDYQKINTIYHRSSINLLIFSTAMFCLIWLNFDDGITTFGLQEDYRQAKLVFLFIGLTRIIDMGAGINSQIISTSTLWRFEFFTGLILLLLALPLNYFLTKQIGLLGPAISNLIAFTIYNAIRYFFLLRKFKMQPFTKQTAITILLAAACYFIAYQLFKKDQGFLWIVIRSAVFSILFVAGVFALRLSPDLMPVLGTLKKRLKSRSSN